MLCASPAFMLVTELGIKTDTAPITVVTKAFTNTAYTALVAVKWLSIIAVILLACLAAVFCQFQVTAGAVLLCFTACGKILLMLTVTALDGLYVTTFCVLIAAVRVFTLVIVASMTGMKTCTAFYSDIAISDIMIAAVYFFSWPVVCYRPMV